MANKDHESLKEISLEIAWHLSEEGSPVGIIPLRKVGVRALGIREEGTGGWSSHTGCIRLPGTRDIPLEVWMDRWTGGRHRRFYCGFTGSDAAILKVVASVPRRYEPRRVFTNRDVANGEYQSLKQSLPESLFGCPVHERLGSRGFFGLYFRDSLSSSQKKDSFVRSAVEFFVNCSDAALLAGHEDDFPTVTERRLVTLHKRAEFARNGRLAKRRKQMDNYTCKICLLRLEDRYGPLGREYAEAHHIVPLHLLPKDIDIQTGINDLITVCPNCHRMLHRMEGMADDWIELQKSLLPISK